MNSQQHKKIAAILYRALRSSTTIAPLTTTYPDITIEDAYRVSEAILSMRITQGQEHVVGKKIGVTSPAVQDMLGVFQPDFGFLTNKMEVDDNSRCRIEGQLIQPRAEAEIAFRLKQDLQGPGVTEDDVLRATEHILPCFEIVDSRIENWQIKIQDTIADNASCGVYVLGQYAIDPLSVNLAELQVVVHKNDQQISTGKSSAVQGNPLTAVAWLANTLGEFGIPFKAGEIILSGSLVPLEPVIAGDTMRMILSHQDHQIGAAEITFC